MATKDPPILAEEEWRLVSELLVQEQSSLHSEIHHTDSPAYEVHLRDRLAVVNRLIERIAPMVEASAG